MNKNKEQMTIGDIGLEKRKKLVRRENYLLLLLLLHHPHHHNLHPRPLHNKNKY
jgi:hypothetical protein